MENSNSIIESYDEEDVNGGMKRKMRWKEISS